MRDDMLKGLGEVTEALYQVELARMQAVLREEARLRAAIARLAAHHEANRGLIEADPGGLRQIGGDILWRSWVGRNKAELQSELARVLGAKGQMIRKLRRAFGKSQAVVSIRTAESAREVRKDAARAEAVLAQIALLDRLQRR